MTCNTNKKTCCCGMSLLYGFLTGAIISSATVLLTTPVSGRTARTKTKESYFHLLNKGQELIENIRDLTFKAQNTLEVGRKKLAPIIDELKESVAQWKEQIAPHQDIIKTQLKEIEEPLQNLEDLVKNTQKK